VGVIGLPENAGPTKEQTMKRRSGLLNVILLASLIFALLPPPLVDMSAPVGPRPALASALPLVVNGVVSGVPKLALLNRLKNSARNCNRLSSVKWKFLMTDRLKVATPGEVRVFLPSVPKKPAWEGVNWLGS